MSTGELLLLVLVVASLVGVVLQYLLILAERRGKRRRQQEMPVVATVTSVEEEIRRKGSRWYVTAVWIDTQTQHMYTFRSPLSLFVQNCSLATPLRSALTSDRQTAT